MCKMRGLEKKELTIGEKKMKEDDMSYGGSLQEEICRHLK